MGVEMEGQYLDEYKNIRTREKQQESISKLDNVVDMVDNLNIDGIETDTQVIKEVVLNNLEHQTNLDDILDSINKVSQGIADIKRSQTNLNKKIKDIQDKVGE